nr:ABC transporter permease [Schleiferilactobacillus perolens]
MRADFYRLRHSRGLLIWEIILLGYTVFTTIYWGRSRNVTGWLGLLRINNTPDLFLWLLPLMMMIVGHDFSQGLLKDTLTIGVSRRRYFLSKMVTAVIVVTLQLFALQLAAFLTGVGMGGLGPVQWGSWLAQLLVYIVLVTTEITLITMILYWSGSTTAAIIVGFIAILVIAMFHMQFVDLEIFNYIDWMMSISRLSTVHLNTLGDVAKPVISAAILIIGGGLVNDWRFEKMSL